MHLVLRDVAAALLLVLAACSSTDQGDQKDDDLLGLTAEEVCPAELPPRILTGPEKVAPIPEPVGSLDAAWACTYRMVPGSASDVLAREIEPRRLETLGEELDRLVPAEQQRACTFDFGDSTLLVYAYSGELGAVVRENYSCEDVYLIEGPLTPGPDGVEPITLVPGTLTGPDSLGNIV